MVVTIDAAIIDLDGTVYRGDHLIPGAREGIRALRESGVEVCFLSNNPTRSPEAFADHLERLGIEISPESIITAGGITNDLLRSDYPDETVFVVGENGLKRQLTDVTLVEDPVEATVVVGSIDREFTYDKLAMALHAFQHEAYAFVGTDPDRTIPTDGDGEIPGSGPIISAIGTAIGRDPDAIAGKPSPMAVSAVLNRLDVAADDCIVIGDRLDTDIAMAGNGGMQSVFVLTGAHDERDIERYVDTPDFVLDSLGSIENVL